MLLGNYSTLKKNPLRLFGSSTGGVRSNFNQTGTMRNLFLSPFSFDEKNSIPDGYRPPGSWLIAQKAGGLSSHFQMSGTGTISTASAAAGVNIEVSLSGSGSLSAIGGLIVSATVALSGTSSFSASLIGVAPGSASMSGSGSLVASLEGLGHLVASLSGSGSLSADIIGIGHMEADITPYTELSPENLASAVWNALVTEFETAGTMGQVQGQTLTKSKFIALK